MGLESETVIDLTTVARVRKALRDKSISAGGDDALIQAYITALSRDAMIRIMKRAIEKKSRTEQFDVSKNQRDFYVLGSPIDTGEDITVYHNVDQPRDFTATADLISSDYIICDADRAEQGIIHIEQDYDAYPNSLQITYTGGMATATCITGTDGVIEEGALSTFKSASGDFVVDGVTAGDILIVHTDGGSNNAWYTIGTVAKTTLAISPAASAAATGETFEISTGFLQDYPDIVLAVTQQVAITWQRKLQVGIDSESYGGMTVKHMPPITWFRAFEEVLRGHARRP